MNTKFTGFIAGSGHHTPVSRFGAHNKRFSPVLRIIPLLNRGKECIHIHMKNDALHGSEYNTVKVLMAIITPEKQVEQFFHNLPESFLDARTVTKAVKVSCYE